MLANASKKLAWIPFASRARLTRWLSPPADHFAPFRRLLRIFSSGRLREQVRFDRNLRVNSPEPNTFKPSPSFLIMPSCDQAVGGERIAFHLFQSPQVHDGELLLENIGKPALRQAAMQRHLAALKAALLAEAGAGALALVPRVEVLPWPEPMPRPMRLRACSVPAGGFNCSDSYRSTPIPPLSTDAGSSSPCRGNTGVSGRSTTWLIFRNPSPRTTTLMLFRRADGTAHQLDLDHALPLHFLHRQAAHLRHRALVAQLFERHDGRLHHVVRIVRADRFGQNVGMPAA